jgi:hypothetical protein
MPDFVTPRHRISPEALDTIVASVAQAEPRIYLVDRFPDLVEAAIRPDLARGRGLILYSHSIYGYSDFGTNAARVRGWLGAITTKVAEARS